MKIKANDTIYIIDDGDTFYGTLEQFQDCFFSNATRELIIDFCEKQNWKLTIKKKIDF